MKMLYPVRFFIALTIILLFLSACQTQQEEVALESKEEQLSYALGFEFARDVQKEQLDVDRDLLVRGLSDGFSSAEPALGPEELEETRSAFLQKKEAAREEIAEKNRAQAEEFLAENAKKDGVETLPSGLQYRIISPGDGAVPTAEDNVKVHFRGYFIDGTEFENTYAKEQPAVYPVRGVIPAWTEALQLMKEGAKWELYVPSELAYGERGAGDIIGPNKALVFELEFIAIH